MKGGRGKELLLEATGSVCTIELGLMILSGSYKYNGRSHVWLFIS
jgi:hypothetical protein